MLLERCGVAAAFGVISIHNMPILDAIGRRDRIRFVPARGEAGATNMADAFARVSGGLGVVITSTGTAAGNAAGAMVEAQTAGTPVLHLTGQIDSPHLDRDRAFIHEARDQLGMLASVSKAAFRVRSAASALSTVGEAVRRALTPPAGPVSVEIPIDIQSAEIARPGPLAAPAPEPPRPDEAALDELADRLAAARRPLLWLGGGARRATAGARRLAAMGFGVVTSTQGRGVVPEDDRASLGAFNQAPPVEAFYGGCDAVLVVGSRLRGNETLGYTLGLPVPLYQIDADALAENRCYPSALFVRSDAALALEGLADRLAGRVSIEPSFRDDLARIRGAAERALRDSLGPYAGFVDALARAAGDEFVWVRDVTLSNSIWGNRLMTLRDPRAGVHALGGGIGQGLPMGIGAAVAAAGRRTIAMVGDGGLQLSLGEIATAVQENVNLLLLVMNDAGYGVIRNIQDARYGGRRYYADLLTPDFGAICRAVGMSHVRIDRIEDAAPLLDKAPVRGGPAMVEVDMTAIGDFATSFAGPPVRTATAESIRAGRRQSRGKTGGGPEKAFGPAHEET